jgi:hypothetical protein
LAFTSLGKNRLKLLIREEYMVKLSRSLRKRKKIWTARTFVATNGIKPKNFLSFSYCFSSSNSYSSVPKKRIYIGRYRYIV